MAYVIATDNAVLWSVRDGGELIAAGVMEQGGVTVTGRELLSGAWEKDLPAVDDTVDWLVWAQSWPEWSAIAVGAPIATGSYVWHDGLLWEVKIGHNKQLDWTPTVAVSLFWPTFDPAEIPAWRQPAGAHDAYPLNYRVTHNGKVWRSLIANNVWTPGAVGSEALWIDESAPVVPPVGAWAVGVAYKVNDEVTYNGALYRCRQAHTSIASWTPPAVLSLWLPL